MGILLNRDYEVNLLDENKVGAKLFSRKSQPKPHEYGLYCPEDDCGVYNIFSYSEEDLISKGARR
ncbi:hypothetical protein COJ45_13585 [Bacillus cereus]|uniref:hypothetical protein n=1 Tax=Bacillus cereus TaxID=1396 RepID=UPI000BF6706C|nr:hypothetical protein [Bacillus cereus]PFM47386.1 hypothetical protein COJ45_13585 [Bacillus cereus]